MHNSWKLSPTQNWRKSVSSNSKTAKFWSPEISLRICAEFELTVATWTHQCDSSNLKRDFDSYNNFGHYLLQLKHRMACIFSYPKFWYETFVFTYKHCNQNFTFNIYVCQCASWTNKESVHLQILSKCWMSKKA